MSNSEKAPLGIVKITEAGYQYPKSRNPYAQKLIEEPGIRRLVYSENNSENQPGRWRDAFTDLEATTLNKDQTPLHVELGCNGGHVVLEWAKLNPKNAFIGLDWKVKQIFFGAQKAQKAGLKNLLFFRANSERLPFMFGPEEIDFLYLYFPDPWQKKSQLKNRWFTANRLKSVAPILKKGATFHIKTDHRGYFDWMVEHIDQVRDLFEVKELTYDLHAGNANAKKLNIPDVTLFERLFIKDGLPIHSVKLIKK